MVVVVGFVQNGVGGDEVAVGIAVERYGASGGSSACGFWGLAVRRVRGKMRLEVSGSNNMTSAGDEVVAVARNVQYGLGEE